MLVSRTALSAAVIAGSLLAQAGDRKDAAGTVQELPFDGVEAPPAPVLTPAEARRALRVADGFRVELVAAEPLVQAPVTARFGPDRRLWVIEMRGYMPNIDGEGETEPDGVIAVLDDADGDGVMDRRVEFLTGLVLPRAIAFDRDDVLVLEPPNLWCWSDVDGDGRADVRELVGGGFEGGIENPEHEANTPTRGLDGWIYFARHGRRLRRASDGSWEWSPVAAGGQWGLSRDDFGRWFFNTNSDYARAHLAPPHYAARNPHTGRPWFVDQRVAKTQEVFPARVTLGVNRAYQRGTLRNDGRLAKFTAACGALLYRGRGFGDAAYGDLFVCEPSGNFVRRAHVAAAGFGVEVAMHTPELEFMTSTDERFRPVDVLQGPDDAIYVVDMARGVIQHRNFVTSYLRKHVEALRLEQPIELGRIWRIASVATTPLGDAPRLDTAKPAQLVAALEDSSGWRRDVAARLLVERGARQVAPALRRLARSDRPSAIRVQALFVLDGLGALDRASLFEALRDRASEVRVAALRLADHRLDGSARSVDEVLLAELQRLTDDADSRVRLQLALTLGSVDARSARRAEADAACVALLGEDPPAPLRDAVLTGLAGRELAFVELLIAAWSDGDHGGTLRRLAASVARRRNPDELGALLGRIAVAAPPHRDALLLGALDGLPKQGTRAARIAREPLLFSALREVSACRESVERVLSAVTWVAPDPSRATAAQPSARGAAHFAASCAACHGFDGQGTSIAPTLAGSEWVLGSPARLARIVLDGVEGPIEVAGETYDRSGMPGVRALYDDTRIAELVSFLRAAWGHDAGLIDATLIARVREATRDRQRPWTARELIEVRD